VRAAATSEGGGPLGPGAEGGSGARLLLVRHAKAGDRHRAAGPDALRPLSAPGRAQATALATSLWPLVAPSVDVGEPPGEPGAGPPRRPGRGAEPEGGAQGTRGSRRQPGTDRVRVYSSPARRCLDTVAPLAGAIGVAIVEVPALGEGDFDAALGFVRGLLDRMQAEDLRDELAVAVVCTHGDILPGAVSALLREAGVLLPAALPAAKASTWMLEWEPGGGLRHAAYVAPPS